MFNSITKCSAIYSGDGYIDFNVFRDFSRRQKLHIHSDRSDRFIDHIAYIPETNYCNCECSRRIQVMHSYKSDNMELTIIVLYTDTCAGNSERGPFWERLVKIQGRIKILYLLKYIVIININIETFPWISWGEGAR